MKSLANTMLGIGVIVGISLLIIFFPGKEMSGEEWRGVFLGVVIAAAIWAVIMWARIVETDKKVIDQALTDLIQLAKNHWENGITHRKLAERAAYQFVLAALSSDDGGPHDVDSLFLDLAMQFHARCLHELEARAGRLQALYGGTTDDEYQQSNEAVKAALREYWDLADTLLRRYGRTKAIKWREDLPADIKSPPKFS